MPLADVVAALQGFAGAYGKVANLIIPESTHELRITAVNHSSFELHILAWLNSPQGVTALHALENVGKGASAVFATIKGYIEIKKFLKGDSYEIIVGDGNTRLIVNRDGEGKEVPKEVINLLQSKTLDADIKKIVAPLDEGVVDTAEITARDETETQVVTVNSFEKAYFGESSGETREDVTLTGRLVSNNKDTLRGTFETSDDKRFPYRYTGQYPDLFQAVYAYRGNVKVSGLTTVDDAGAIKRLDITNAVAIQQELDL